MTLLIRSHVIPRAWLFPLIASATWFTTLSVLLVYWLGSGRPIYPGQSNPYVAFISDIAAFDLKPVFTVGSTITAVTYSGTIWTINHFRYSGKHHAQIDVTRWRKDTSTLAVITSVEASISLLLLTAFDTFRAHERHKILLFSTFGGLSVNAVLTSVVWSDQMKMPSNNVFRKWYIINTVLVFSSMLVGGAFVALLKMSWFRTAGFFEWTLTYLGAFWLFSFLGFLKIPSATRPQAEAERQPLLSPDRISGQGGRYNQSEQE